MAKFCLSYLNDFDIENFIDYKKLPANMSFDSLGIFEQIIINDFIKFISLLKVDLISCDFKSIHDKTISFIKNNFIGFYLESARYNIINLPANSLLRRQIQNVLNEVKLYFKHQHLDICSFVSHIIPYYSF